VSLALLTPSTVESVKRDDPDVIAQLRQAFEGAFQPDVVIVNARGAPVSQEPYRGWDGYLRWIRETFDVLDGCGLEVESNEAVGGSVLSGVRVTGTLRLTGIDGDFRWWVVSYLRAGRVARAEAFLDEAEARRAAEGGPG
jgi:hypothetical protein